MLEKSESLPRKKCTHCSLCERCCAENTERGWKCKDADSTPFLKQKIFIQQYVKKRIKKFHILNGCFKSEDILKPDEFEFLAFKSVL